MDTFELLKIIHLKKGVNALCVLNGTKVLAAMADETESMKLIDVSLNNREKDPLLHTFYGHNSQVLCLDYTLSAKNKILSGGKDGLKLWEFQQNRVPSPLENLFL